MLITKAKLLSLIPTILNLTIGYGNLPYPKDIYLIWCTAIRKRIRLFRHFEIFDVWRAGLWSIASYYPVKLPAWNPVPGTWFVDYRWLLYGSRPSFLYLWGYANFLISRLNTCFLYRLNLTFNTGKPRPYAGSYTANYGKARVFSSVFTTWIPQWMR